jgi:lipoprotein NlpI
MAVAALGGLLAGAALAQSRGTSTSSGSTGNNSTTPGTTSRGTNSTSIPNTTTTTNNNTTTPANIRPIFLSGRVAMDDGSALPGPATIIRVCNGSRHAEGYTDSTGSFQIQLGNELGVMQDASETSGYRTQMPGTVASGSSGLSGTQTTTTNSSTSGMDRKLTGCELQASLAGLRSQSVILSALQPLDSPTNVGTILLHRTTNGEEGNTVSATSLAAPKDARRAFEKGLTLAKKGKVDDAFREYQKAVMLYPAYATAWCELGKIEAARGQFDIARGSFNEAVKADPKYVDPYLQLSRIALNAKNWPELAEFTGKAIALDSFDYPQEFLFDAVAHYNMHEYDQAEKSIVRANALDTRRQFPQIVYLKGLVMVQHKNYAAAAEDFRTYLKLAPDAEDAPTVRQQLAQIEKYAGQTAQKQ